MHTTLAAGPASVGQGRRAVTAELAGRGVAGEVIELVELMASELLTNAVLYAGGDIRLLVSVADGVIRVEVRDASGDRPVLRRPPADSTSGRGVAIIDALASRWGVDDVGSGGKAVWFEVIS